MRIFIKVFWLSLIVVVGVKVSAAAWAADTLKLTLDECYRLAQEKGLGVERLRWQVRALEADYQASRRGQYPQLSLRLDAPSWWEALDERVVYDPVLDRQVFYQIPSGERRYQSELSLQNALPWGAQLELSSRLYRRHWYWNRDEDRLELNEYSLLNRISLYQPLLEGNPVGRERTLARLRYLAGRVGYEEQWRDYRYRLASLFYRLVSAQKELDIARDDFQVGHQSLELAERKLKAGLIPEVELLQIKVDLARREVALRSAQSELLSAREELVSELGLEGKDVVIEPIFEEEDTLLQTLPEDAIPQEDLGVLRQRLELRQRALASRAEVISERIKAWLRVSFEADARRKTLDSLDLPTSRNRGLFLHIELPLFGFGATNAKIEGMRAQLRQTELDYQMALQRSGLQRKEALRRLARARDRWSIALAALQVSQKSLEITQKRYESGLVSARELLDAQLDHTRTRRDLLAAKVEYDLARINLDRWAPLPKDLAEEIEDK